MATPHDPAQISLFELHDIGSRGGSCFTCQERRDINTMTKIDHHHHHHSISSFFSSTLLSIRSSSRQLKNLTMSVEQHLKASTKRHHEQESDESLSASPKRRRFQYDSTSSKENHGPERKNKRQLSTLKRNVTERMRRANLANGFAALDAELPHSDTSRTRLVILKDATEYIRELKDEWKKTMEIDQAPMISDEDKDMYQQHAKLFHHPI
ncbi:predicted protein [Lichtheimia corymbifera JMRC:FSU:9682]|uniref:BHLH domain-containing protein n=1 Tax=Lichtheimia corymbifera JMRC:FSU:9682 TaxID=1263082 RepID=A0A068SAQ0_9FUNG|nr:predicted protein [Lichtheimia corymbifera JMRC:FSU:9682]